MNRATNRIRIVIRGAVQGVGFRPFVYRLAEELKLCGWVSNSPQGVFIEVEGDRCRLDSFLLRLEKDKPPAASIRSLEYSILDPVSFRDFEIRPSLDMGSKTTLVTPDIATCRDCLTEIFDPNDRRYIYPFTNCTNCGPRYSIVESLPYDRTHTAMKYFSLCPECRREYEDPLDRRFHAQPNACPVCGPKLEAWNESGKTLSEEHDALLTAVECLRSGKIVALKGLGGFQLLVDALDEAAVTRLRKRKRREEKPFALMYATLESVEVDCTLSALEKRLLTSPESPIVLLRRKSNAGDIAPSVAPRNPELGVMLPYTPLHHILMRELRQPVVATSGNVSDEPICIDEKESLNRLAGIADMYLVHNRPIIRYVDDSIARLILGRELLLRRARGYAPLPMEVPEATTGTLAVGAHLKNTVSITVRPNIFVSQHIGDLESKESTEAFRNTITSLESLYDTKIERVVGDMHPDYLSTKYAHSLDVPILLVQHHFSHVASCMAENSLEGPVLGVAWDGTGYGEDGTVWGGEFLHCTYSSFRRVAHFRQFKLPGGDKAIREPRRSALGIGFEIFGDDLFQQTDGTFLSCYSGSQLSVLQRMLNKDLNSPRTSSVGRLFDAVAFLLGLREETTFEGQAAMELEHATDELVATGKYPFQLSSDSTNPSVIDWGPLITAILDNLEAKVPVGKIAARFHNTLAAIIVEVAERVGVEGVVLSGGCFQNKILTERTVEGLESKGFRPYCHQRIPPNDGGISLGQAAIAVHTQGWSD
jgi:hydrogenase maturation protein HypF